jgi:hypothetical protein
VIRELPRVQSFPCTDRTAEEACVSSSRDGRVHKEHEVVALITGETPDENHELCYIQVLNVNISNKEIVRICIWFSIVRLFASSSHK